MDFFSAVFCLVLISFFIPQYKLILLPTKNACYFFDFKAVLEGCHSELLNIWVRWNFPLNNSRNYFFFKHFSVWCLPEFWLFFWIWQNPSMDLSDSVLSEWIDDLVAIVIAPLGADEWESLISRLIDWLIDCVIVRLWDRSIDWLILLFVSSVHPIPTSFHKPSVFSSLNNRGEHDGKACE